MTNLRRTPALIGIASAVAAIAFVPGPEISLVRPAVYNIRVGADTVWFCADVYPEPATVTYTFARASRQWGKSPVLAPACAVRDQAATGDSVSLIGRRIVAIVHRPDSQKQVSGFISIHDSVSRRRIDLKASALPSNLRPLVNPAYIIEGDTVSTAIGATTANDSLIYIGLSGGFPEGHGSLGGVFRVDRRRGTFELITDSTLAEHTITGLVSAGRWLWAGTFAPGEYGAYGSAGLLRMDQATRAWKAYTHENSPLPDAFIRSVVSDGRVLAVATEKGIAVLELSAPRPSARDSSVDESIARWNVGWFTHAFRGDSLVFEIGDSVAGRRTDSLEASLTVAQESAVRGRERLVFQALAHVPPDSFRGLGLYEIAKLDASDTSVAAVYTTMLAARMGQSQRLAALAIGELGPAAPEPARVALRQAFFRFDSVRAIDERQDDRGIIGRSLARVGDTTIAVWARAVIEAEARGSVTAPDDRRAADIATAIEILRDNKDPVILSLLIAMTPAAPERARGHLFLAISSYDTPAAWGAILSFVNQRLFNRGWLYNGLKPGAFSDPIVSARVREVITTELRSGDRYAHVWASQAIRRLRLTEMIPELVRLYSFRLVGDSAIVESTQALISLTGRADSPLFPDPGSGGAIAGWWANWLKENPSPRAVTWEAGERAVEEWQRRRRAR